jgi:hypothetical protein
MPQATRAQTPRVWISTESELLGQASSLAISSDGALLVLDRLNSYVLVLKEPGTTPLKVGREGSGPGEFRGAAQVYPLDGGFEVLDAGNNRVQRFDGAGHYVSARQLPPFASNYPSALSPDGRIAVNTLGDSLLMTLYDVDSNASARFVKRIVEMPRVISMSAAREEIQQGRVPAFFRNTLLPRFDVSGGVWVAHITDGRIELWSDQGLLQAQHQLDEPELPAIRRTFFEQYRDPAFRGLRALSFVADISSAPSGLWVLLNQGEDEPAVLVRISRSGQRSGRWVLDGLRGAGKLVVDEPRRRVFFSIPSTAEVIEIPLPGG